MTDQILFFVEGRPRPFSLVANMPGRSFKPKPLKVWQQKVHLVARQAMNQVGFISPGGPYRMDLVFCFTTKTTKVPAWFHPRPDIDNIRKAVMDALGDLLPDDSRVVIGETAKVYRPGAQGVWVSISPVGTVQDELARMGFPWELIE